jgi:hypothetical protein
VVVVVRATRQRRSGYRSSERRMGGNAMINLFEHVLFDFKPHSLQQLLLQLMLHFH